MAAKSTSHKVMGEALKAIRTKQNRTLQDVMRDLKIDTSGLSRVERGLQGFAQDTLIGLLDYYGIDLPALLVNAAGLSEGDLGRARPRTQRQSLEPAISAETMVPSADGWIEHNPVLSTREFAGHTMMLCRRSFENPEFELVYMGRVMRNLDSLIAAKSSAPGFARRVLREECQRIPA